MDDVKGVRAISDAMWVKLFKIVSGRATGNADTRYVGLHKSLTLIKEQGTLVVSLSGGRWGLRPEFGAGRWKNQEHYNRHRDKLLRPFHGELVECLGVLCEGEKLGGKLGEDGDKGLGLLADSEQVVKVKAALETKGYCALRSSVLGGEVIYLARTKVDGERAVRGKEGAMFYTLQEISYLYGDDGLTQEQVREVHSWKKTLGATILKGG